jgi:hypothetical protein
VMRHVIRALIFAAIFGVGQYVVQDAQSLGQIVTSVLIATCFFAAFMGLADKIMEKK